MKKQTFLQGSLVLIVSAIVVKVIGALFKVPLANMLGGDGMNYFSCGYSLFLPVYAVMINGLSPSISKLTAERHSRLDSQSVEEVKYVALRAFGVMGLVGSILMVALARVFCTYVADNPNAYLSVMVLAPSVGFGCVASVYRGYYEGMCNMYPTSISQLLEALGKLIFGLTLCNYAITHYDQLTTYFPNVDMYALASASAILGISLSSGVSLLALMAFKPHTCERVKLSKGAWRGILREILAIMLPIAVGSLMTNLTTLIDLATIVRCLDVLPKGELLSRYQVQTENLSGFVYGSYTGLAITIFNLVPSVTNMLSKGALPNVVNSWQCRDLTTLKRDVSNMLSLTALIAVPSGLGITFLARQILTFLYPQRLDEVLVSYESLAYMGLGVVCMCMAYPLFSVLQGIDRADLPIKVMLVGVVVKLLGNLLLLSIPSVAVYGAGISTSACYLVVFVLAFVEFAKVTKVKVDLIKLTLPILYASIMCTVGAVVTCDMVSRYHGNSLGLVLGILIGGCAYVTTLYLLGYRLNDPPK